MKKLFLLLLLVPALMFGQCPPEKQGPEGAGRNAKEKMLNREKNRSCVVSGDQFDTIPITEILKPGIDVNRYSINQVVTVTGYVRIVKYGGAESCNCKTSDK